MLNVGDSNRRFLMLDEGDSDKLTRSAIPRRLSNLTLQPQGEVKGSEENVRKEEIFLCERLIEETSSCKEFRLTQWISWNSHVVSMLQGMRRPVCGLVALCMAGHMLKRYDPAITVYDNDEAILKVARNMGFTKQGEMFSAKQCAELAMRVYECEAVVLNDALEHSCKTVIEHLAEGFPILVPYDTDRNYEPCQKNGHKAHWAILTGFVVGQSEQFWRNPSSSSRISYMSDSRNLYKALGSIQLNPSLVYVYAKQGKSARQQLWPLTALSASNANLNEVSPERDANLYFIPREGIKMTLRSQTVLLSPKGRNMVVNEFR